MDFATWLLFLGTEIVLSLVPGPAVVFVVTQGLRAGRRAAMVASLGILAANAIWFVASALGIGAVLVALPGLLTALRWAGAAYIAWLGVDALRPRPHANAGMLAGATAAPRPFRTGVLLQLANPKALLFFAAILPGFVAIGRTDAWPPWLQIAVLGITSIAAEIQVLFGYATLAAAASSRLGDPVFAQRVERGAGLVLLAVAAWLVLAP
jgi:homoserine/homoserine lactone efflux protein